MPFVEHNGAKIYYEEYGKGFPILTFAPAGVKSTIAVWSQPMSPINPMTEWASQYRVIVMDQRNAGGKSWAPITAKDGWHSFAADHLAILDQLKIDRCHLYGQCIGGSFIMALLKAQPKRFPCAVLAQPIGRVGPLKPGRAPRFDEWAKGLTDHPELTEAILDAYHHNLYAAGFLYSVDRDFVKNCRTPCIVMAGNDDAHPFPIAEETAKLLPDAEFIPEWKTGAALESARKRVKDFYAKHTPA
ncbi:MAG: alpha/beta hydrolase [Betaproteobacteria bacterium]|nr:alpha/beta hydrolase [Betaproteobacteria bacterium]